MAVCRCVSVPTDTSCTASTDSSVQVRIRPDGHLKRYPSQTDTLYVLTDSTASMDGSVQVRTRPGRHLKRYPSRTAGRIRIASTGGSIRLLIHPGGYLEGCPSTENCLCLSLCPLTESVSVVRQKIILSVLLMDPSWTDTCVPLDGVHLDGHRCPSKTDPSWTDTCVRPDRLRLDGYRCPSKKDLSLGRTTLSFPGLRIRTPFFDIDLSLIHI